jgi:GrpB-like predicted nucleotidyltransferase (UPF0157 family)
MVSTRILIVAYDPNWPAVFAQEAAGIRSVLGARALQIEHAGSTAVPGLAAKPIIDLILAVADLSAEGDYAPSLEADGYTLQIMRTPKQPWSTIFSQESASVPGAA